MRRSAIRRATSGSIGKVPCRVSRWRRGARLWRSRRARSFGACERGAGAGRGDVTRQRRRLAVTRGSRAPAGPGGLQTAEEALEAARARLRCDPVAGPCRGGDAPNSALRWHKLRGGAGADARLDGRNWILTSRARAREERRRSARRLHRRRFSARPPAQAVLDAVQVEAFLRRSQRCSRAGSPVGPGSRSCASPRSRTEGARGDR